MSSLLVALGGLVIVGLLLAGVATVIICGALELWDRQKHQKRRQR